MVTPATDELKKRKRPPTFAHLPAPRAKKLKRVWVEKTKIKSKWKAMKRKEGWVSGPEDHRREEQEQDGGDEMLDDVADSADEHSDHLSDTQVDESQPEPVHRELEPQTRLDSRGKNHPVHDTRLNHGAKLKSKPSAERLADRKSKPIPKTRSAEKQRRESEDEEDEEEEEKPSLRELTREAYSRTSLHTFKADPLKRRRGARPTLPQAPRGRGGAPSSGRGAIRGSRGSDRGARGRGGDGGGRGRDVRGGQPNMKLRMGAMLERIKRDLT